MIEGVQIKKIIKYCDDRGFLAEILKENDPFFKNIKQTTYTESFPGVIKAFHYHKTQDDIWFVSRGLAQIVLHDLRQISKTSKETQVIYSGDDNPLLIFIPRGVAHGYRVLGNEKVGLFYHTTESYDPENPDEFRIDYDSKEIGFDWTTKNK